MANSNRSKLLKHIIKNDTNIVNNRSTIDPGDPLDYPLDHSGLKKQPQRVPRDPQETLKIHQRGSKRVPRGSKRVPRRILGPSWGLFRSLLGSLLDALGLTCTQKDDYHDF